MKIDEKIASHQERYGSRPFFSLEVFPPKTEMGLLNLYDRFARFAVMHPIWVDVTWGAGGSTATKTVEICKQLLHYHGLEALIHLTCTNMSVETIDQALDECVANKIVNILALRGDAPTGQQWEAAEGGFNHAVDLLKYIHKRHPGVFCVGVAGYPEGHLENPSKEDDLNRLKEKVDGGASFVITQLFYDCDEYFDFVRRAREIGVPKSVPIIPGVMPIQSYPGFCKMTGFCKTKVPAKLREQLELVKGDEASVKLFGVDHAVEMCRTLPPGQPETIHLSQGEPQWRLGVGAEHPQLARRDVLHQRRDLGHLPQRGGAAADGGGRGVVPRVGRRGVRLVVLGLGQHLPQRVGESQDHRPNRGPMVAGEHRGQQFRERRPLPRLDRRAHQRRD
eukprot:Selendium_serpulae@DN4609_c0_g1_i1.p1